MARRISNTIGIDDAPFHRSHRGDVDIVGAVFTRTRIDGAVTGKVRRDGRNATPRIAQLVRESPFSGHVQAILLGGITLAGFNVVDIRALHERAGIPVLVVIRKRPDLATIKKALLGRVPGGQTKWTLLERTGPALPCEGLYVQFAGMDIRAAGRLITELRVHGRLPEPVRVAHLLAGAFARGVSHGRA